MRFALVIVAALAVLAVAQDEPPGECVARERERVTKLAPWSPRVPSQLPLRTPNPVPAAPDNLGACRVGSVGAGRAKVGDTSLSHHILYQLS